MARASGSSTKFASVNLNKSYGKPATSQGPQLQGSGAARSRSHGGMVLLSRPTRSQPAVPATAVLQKGSKLTVPLPVNLPSLRREHSGNDPNIALVGGTGASGWPRQQQQQPQVKEADEAPANPVTLQQSGQEESNIIRSTPALSAGSTWGTSPPAGGQLSTNSAAAQFIPVNGEVRPPFSTPMLGARSGVYTPPRARTVLPNVNAVQPPPRPVAVEKAVVLRGEDFPTLQAALPPPLPPQQRQKELQQRQREKQQELKDQQQKLQLLSQKSSGEEPRQPRLSSPELQPVLGLTSGQSLALPNGSVVSLEPQVVPQGASKQGPKPEGIPSYGPPLIRVNQRSNWTDDEREPAHSLRPMGAHGQYPDRPDRPERDHYHDDSRRSGRGDDYGFGRQSSLQRDNLPSFGTGNRDVSGRDLDSGREDGFGRDGHTRDGSYNLASSNSRDERSGRDGLGSRDGFHGREGGYSGDRGHFKDGGFGRDSGVGRDGGFGREGGYGRPGGFTKDNNLPSRDGFGRSGGGGREFMHEREGFHFRDGFAKENGPREQFFKEPNHGRDGSFNRDGPYGRDNRRPRSGDGEGGRGRFGGDRFPRAGSGRFGGNSDFSESKGNSFGPGRGMMGFDAGLDFGREKRFGAPYSEDSFARDFPDLPGLEFRSSGVLGEGGSGLESKLLRRKKEEAQVSAVYDLEREAFEAELERVQLLQEQERLRKLEEKERAIEQARKEQEEQERLAREEAERQLRLEEEAREALARAEEEVLEAARKIEEERKAREEAKRFYLLEEEKRKDNARRKLLELEERIAKREAGRKFPSGEELLESERFKLQRQVLEYDLTVRMDASGVQEEVEVTSQILAEQDDDDRAPLRPSPRPASPLPRPREEISSRLKSPDTQTTRPGGRRLPDFSRGNAFEGDRSRPLMSWRRDALDNGMGPPQISMYGRDDVTDHQFNMPSRERMYFGRREYPEREVFHGSLAPGVPFEGEYPQRRSQGHQERRWPGDEAGSFNKRSVSPRATTPDGDGPYSENAYEREGDRHWGRDKLSRQRSRDGGWGSPPPPSSYLQVPDPPESTSYGRLRQSLAKQPRVPPPPLRTPVHRAPLTPGKDFANSFPSPLLHSGSDDAKDNSGQRDGAPEHHSNFSSRIGARSQPSDDSAAVMKAAESEPEEYIAPIAEKSNVKETSGLTTSLRPQRTYLQSARDSLSESHDENAGHQQVSTLADISFVHPAASESGVEADEASDEEQSPRGLTEDEARFERDEFGSGETEKGEEVSARYFEDAHLQKALELEDEAEVDDEEEFDDEADFSGEGDFDDGDYVDEVDQDVEGDVEDVEPDEEDVAGEWEDELDQEDGVEGGEHTPVEFQEEFHASTLVRKDDSETEVSYKEYEDAGVLGPDDVGAMEDDFGDEVKHPELASQEPTEFREQEENYMQLQAVPQPYLQHPGGAASVPLTSVLPVQGGQAESYGPQVQQPLSFMALSLPQSHTTSGTAQVPSLVASLPVLQSSQDGPVTLQFGLLPSTPLISSSVPAIQIGSIQMPLQIHSQTGTQPPVFQFGQLGQQPPLPAFVHSVPVPQPPMQQHGVSASAFHPVSGAAQESTSVASLKNNDTFTSIGDQAALDPTMTPWMSNPEQNTSRGTDIVHEEGAVTGDGGKPVVGQSERRARGSRIHESRVAPFLKSSDGALESSSSENSLVTAGDTAVDNQGVENVWNRPSTGGRGRGSGGRWGGPVARGRSKSGASAGGRVSVQGITDGPAPSLVSYIAEPGMDAAVRPRSSRRSSYRRTEFKVRDPAIVSDRTHQEGAASGKYGMGSGILSDASGPRDTHRDPMSQFQDRKYYGNTGQSAPSMSGRRPGSASQNKMHRSGSSEAPSKAGGRGVTGSGASSGPGGVLGKYITEVTLDSSPFQQHGAVSDDDYIMVRSKRQMLNDRREQKEKELKAKTKDLKAKEQAARKQQRAAMKGGHQGDAAAASTSRPSGLGPEKRIAQTPTLDAGGSTTARTSQPGVTSGTVPPATLTVSSNMAQPQPPIGTPAGGSAELGYDKRLKNAKSRGGSASSGNINEVDVAASAAFDSNDSTSSSTVAWGGSRSTLQVVSLTQIQLEEAMKPVRFEAPVPQQLPFGDRQLVLEPVVAIPSTGAKEKLSTPALGPIESLVAEERFLLAPTKSLFGAMPNSRPITPGLNAVVGSTIGPRVDGPTDENELKNKSKRLSGAGKEVGSFPGKSKRTRGDEERGGDVVDAEAEAAASAVAVAAISSDESVGSTHHGDGQSLSLRAVGLQNPTSQTTFGQTSATGLHGMSIGDAGAEQVLNPGSGLEESMSVALPADLSVEPTSISLQGPASRSAGLLLPSLPGAYRGLEMGTLLGAPMFGFGVPGRDGNQGLQGAPPGSVHDQGMPTGGATSAGWQPQPAGGVDSYYAGPPSSFAGPFINPTGGIPSIQGPPHMLVYTNPFASVSQFGQLGVSFMGPQQYMPSGKPPDWKHTPPSSAGMNAAEVGGLGGIMHAQRSAGATNNAQRLAPGSSLMSSPGPFDLNLSAPFQVPGVEVSMQPQWSHVPGQPLHSVPISGPLMGLAGPQRHPRAANHMGHLPPHVMESNSGFNMIAPSNPVSSGLFQQVDPAAQFPDELGLGDSSSTVTNSGSSFRSPRPSNRAPSASGGVVASSGSTVGGSNKQLRTGRRASRVARAGSSLAGGGGGGGGGGGAVGGNISNVGMPSGAVAAGQPANGSRAPSPHLSTTAQSPPIGVQSHPNPFSDPRNAPHQNLARVGVASGGWSGQVRKGGPGRPPSSERGDSGDKPFTSSSSGKVKQVYVAKPSSSPRRNVGDAPSNVFGGGAETGKSTVSH